MAPAPSGHCSFAPRVAFRIVPRIWKETGMSQSPNAILRLAAAALAFLGATTLATAAEKPVLTVYTYSSFSGEYGPGGVIKQRFEAVCGCTLNYVETEDAGTLLARLKLEGESSR